MKKVAVLLATGFEEIEALATVDILRRAKIAVTLTSVEESLVVEGSHNIRVVADILLDDLDASSVQMIVLPGGLPGATRLKGNPKVIKLIQDFESAGKAVAAICAAPIVLGEAGILQDTNAVCYPGFESQLIGANILDRGVVVDGAIITAKGAGLTYAFALEIIGYLMGKEIAKEVQEKMLIPDVFLS